MVSNIESKQTLVYANLGNTDEERLFNWLTSYQADVIVLGNILESSMQAESIGDLTALLEKERSVVNDPYGSFDKIPNDDKSLIERVIQKIKEIGKAKYQLLNLETKLQGKEWFIVPGRYDTLDMATFFGNGVLHFSQATPYNLKLLGIGPITVWNELFKGVGYDHTASTAEGGLPSDKLLPFCNSHIVVADQLKLNSKLALDDFLKKFAIDSTERNYTKIIIARESGFDREFYVDIQNPLFGRNVIITPQGNCIYSVKFGKNGFEEVTRYNLITGAEPQTFNYSQISSMSKEDVRELPDKISERLSTIEQLVGALPEKIRQQVGAVSPRVGQLPQYSRWQDYYNSAIDSILGGNFELAYDLSKKAFETEGNPRVTVLLGSMCIHLGLQQKNNQLLGDGEQYLNNVFGSTNTDDLSRRIVGHNLRLLYDRTGKDVGNHQYMKVVQSKTVELTAVN